MHDWSATTATADPRHSDAGFGLAAALRAWSASRALALLSLLAACALLPGMAAAAGACSPYMGQVVINEVRVGNSNGTDLKNQVEILNTGAVAPEVWRTWRIDIYLKDGTKAPVRKGSYSLGTGFTANGAFIYNNVTKLWLQNRSNKLVDIALLDANGDFVAYLAIGGSPQTVPGCFGTPTTLQSSGSGDETGSVHRTPDGGAWPAALTKTAVHSIGRTNDCTTTGKDLVMAIEADYAKPVRNSTQVTYTVTLINNSCSGISKVSGIEVTISNFSTASFASITTTPTKDVAVGASSTLWKPDDLEPGTSAMLTFRGTPKVLGPLTTTAAVFKPTSGLVNLDDDSASETIDVQEYNYVHFELDSATLTEGTDSAYSAAIELNVPLASKTVTVSYSVSGGAGDIVLLGNGSTVTIAAGETSTSIDFTITNDNVHEPTKTIVLTITGISVSGGGDPTVVVEPSGNTMTITLLDDDPPVHHYELALPSSSLACLASTVTVKACADASSPCTNPSTAVNGQTATLATSAGTLGATTLSFDANGVATTTLSHPAATHGAGVTVTLSGEQVAASHARQCCPNGSNCVAAGSCATTFATAGFIVSASTGGGAATIPTQTAGSSSGSYVLRAVTTGSTTKACEAAITGTTTVNWSYQCNDPGTCSAGNRMTLTGNSAVAIAGNPHGSSASSTAVSMSFDADGNAPFSFSHADVGRVTLQALGPAGGALLAALAGNSNAFVVKPAGFTLSGIQCTNYAAGACATAATPSPGANPGGSTVTGTAFMPAGRAFSATVTAIDAAGNPTPNYGRENVPEGVALTASLVAPAGGHAPALSNASAFGSFSGGAATGTGFAWSEVGAITLTPSVADGDYLGTGNVTGTTSGAVGRFVADHFTVAVTPACSGAFSYSGQPFTATVSAHNAAGALLQNYDGTRFAKTVTLADAAALGVGIFSAGSSVAAGAFGSGVADATPAYTFTNKLTAPGTLVLRATDSDGASSAGHAEGSTVLRSGRLRLSNAFGRETAPLTLTAQAEYWTGRGWLLNGSDNCTTVPAAAVAFSNQRNHLGAATAAWSTGASALAIASGSGLLTLAAPSPAGTGSVDIAVNLGSGAADQSCLASHPASSGAGVPWLRSQNGSCAATFDRDPSARATFGIHAPETRRTVHARELF